jgi:WD40 repeat protein
LDRNVDTLHDGRARIVVGYDDGSVHFFELMPPGPLTRTTLATWSPTDAIVATALDTGSVVLHQWHAISAHLEELARLGTSGASVASLCFSADGTRLQVLTADGTERILDATTLQPDSPPVCAWSAPLTISPDGAWRALIRDGRLVVEAAPKETSS